MDISVYLAPGSLVISLISAVFAGMALINSRRLQKAQREPQKLNLRRDVLRRLFAYRYRLTESLMGGDGEPFIALNEARIVYAGFPRVTEALNKMHRELGIEGLLSLNIVALVRAMANAANVSVDDLDESFIERPFTPPAAKQ
ncbi:MAG: hypothetical protein F4X83_04510 [Chloroflexi bacterium]|nr:hypothetical protein [Chloroflexota bacterium]